MTACRIQIDMMVKYVSVYCKFKESADVAKCRNTDSIKTLMRRSRLFLWTIGDFT